MYNSALLLATIDANSLWVLLGFGTAMLFQCWWLGHAVLIARRDQRYSIPIFCTLYWFAHDLSVVLRFKQWFFEYNHWYLKLFWLGLLLALLLECLFLMQILRYGRKELMPQASKRHFAGLILLAIGASIVIHEFFKAYFGDPLYQLDPTLTMLVYPVFGALMMLRRGSMLGQNATMWWTFSAMTLCFHLTTYLFFGQQFSSPGYLFAGVIAAALGLVMGSASGRRALIGVATGNCSAVTHNKKSRM